jgi:hypothetical protein
MQHSRKHWHVKHQHCNMMFARARSCLLLHNEVEGVNLVVLPAPACFPTASRHEQHKQQLLGFIRLNLQLKPRSCCLCCVV